ncbi:hypothetical protein [Burkholderia metallica]|uniref:hypothetical protein n=1 Tax=Burkholderia metallica TaxID=488729 RepID=UPI00157AFE7C|nr:hypothetical protein [Burkholderia metallica]
MEETVPTIHTAMVRRNIPIAKKRQDDDFVASALQQNGDETMTKTAPERPPRGFRRMCFYRCGPDSPARITEQDSGRDGMCRWLE